MRTPLIASSIALMLATACPPVTPDGGEGEGGEGEGGEGEGGEGEGEGEGEGDPGTDAHQLCVITNRGILGITVNITAGFAAAFSRCSADELAQQTTLPEEALVQIEASCTPEAGLEPYYQAAIDGGNVTFHMDRIRACAALDFQLFSPTSAEELPPDCANLTTGSLLEDAPCVDHWECVAGLRCEAPDIYDDAKACLPPAGEGDDCVPPDASQGLTVETNSARSCAAGLQCVDGSCVQKGGASDPCDVIDCADDLFCSDALLCTATLPAGQPCSADEECNDGLSCVQGSCGTKLDDGDACDLESDACAAPCSVCRVSAIDGPTQCLDRGGQGEPCTTDNDCRNHFVCGGSTCEAGADVDAPCDQSAQCRTGLSCDQTLGTCQDAPALDEACEADGPACAEGTCLDGVCAKPGRGDPCSERATCTSTDDEALACVDGVCGDPPTSGPCSDDGECAEGFICSEDPDTFDETCVPAPDVDEACLPDGGCGEELFCDSTSNTCKVKALTGAVCTENDGCESGTCVNGQCAATAASCLGDPQTFPLFVVLSSLLPLRRRLLRGRARR